MSIPGTIRLRKGVAVSMCVNGGFIEGVTVDEPCLSPTVRDGERFVVRVRWADGSESIEWTDKLFGW